MAPVRIAILATDPLSLAGLVRYLESCPEVTLLDGEHRAAADVVALVAERLTPDVVGLLRRTATQIGKPVVLIVGEVTEAELLTAVKCRVVAILPRAAVTGERLLHSVRAAADGGGVLPPHLVGELLKHVERLQHDVLSSNGLTAAGLTPREVDVLRLMADGLDTAEVAVRLRYSERTVKNVIYGMTHRLKLRNRSHAVAYAVRSGVI